MIPDKYVEDSYTELCIFNTVHMKVLTLDVDPNNIFFCLLRCRQWSISKTFLLSEKFFSSYIEN